MTYQLEDEVDWSDGTIDDPPPVATVTSEDSGYVSPVVHEDGSFDYLFEPQEENEYEVPLGTALPPVAAKTAVTRAQRARIGVHLNRRQPSEQDYAHFALYQANQKAYEATFLKHYVNHALHPSQFDQCFQDGVDASFNVQKYVASVSGNINAITNKIIWNAHCRVVNLLANAGRDGAPFWDISSFERDVFAESDPSSSVLIAHKMKGSWHRTAPKPSMVRYTTRDYPIGNYTSPFEEIDEVADSLFSEESFGSSLPPGREVRRPTARKGKGRGLSDAGVRDTSIHASRDNWLASLIPPAIVEEYPGISPNETVPATTAHNINPTTEPRILSDLRQLQDYGHDDAPPQTSPLTLALEPNIDSQPSGLTQLERLFEQFGSDALSSQHHTENHAPSEEYINEVFQRALPGIRAVIAEAISQGFRPVDPNFEELIVDIEAREQSTAVSVLVPEEVVQHQNTQHQDPKPQDESRHGTKRRREQRPPIRMFNTPIEPKSKRRRVDVNSTGPSVASTTPRTPREQKSTTTRLPKPPSAPKLVNKKVEFTPAPASTAPLTPHPSGSTTLEPHQQLPPSATFTPDTPDCKPAWRCSIKHALGHYYNAGDRKNCPGCFTALSDNQNAQTMDFFLPSRTHYHQLNPAARWRPSKPFPRARRSKSLSHNSIAKVAYWAAIAAGTDDGDAIEAAIAAVYAHIAPKQQKEPSPVPSPSPEPDLGPHPSGSATMEHAQDLPSCATFSAPEEGEESAWRCDVNHALGRYYLAGDKRSCPGCGSNKGGKGKHAVMDFWLPRGVVVRQEVDVVLWKPRKPYRARDVKGAVARTSAVGSSAVSSNVAYSEREPKTSTKGKEKANTPTAPHANSSSRNPSSRKTRPKHFLTHNQLASRKYWDAIARGLAEDEALAWAVQEVEEWVDGRAGDVSVSGDDHDDNHEEVSDARGSDEKTEKRGGKGAASRGKKERDADVATSRSSTSRTSTARPSTSRKRDGKPHAHPALTSSLALNALRSGAYTRSRHPYLSAENVGFEQGDDVQGVCDGDGTGAYDMDEGVDGDVDGEFEADDDDLSAPAQKWGRGSLSRPSHFASPSEECPVESPAEEKRPSSDDDNSEESSGSDSE